MLRVPGSRLALPHPTFTAGTHSRKRNRAEEDHRRVEAEERGVDPAGRVGGETGVRLRAGHLQSGKYLVSLTTTMLFDFQNRTLRVHPRGRLSSAGTKQEGNGCGKERRWRTIHA
jgi:hypothetical protein